MIIPKAVYSHSSSPYNSGKLVFAHPRGLFDPSGVNDSPHPHICPEPNRLNTNPCSTKLSSL